jgi:hypothetical protein
MRERSEVANFASGIGFRFDSADVIPEQLDKFWDSLTTSERELLKNPETDAVVYGHASRPGDRSVNAVLSEARADAFAEGLREKGARARIETVGQGERWAMQDGWLEDMDKADYRVAVLRIEPPFTDSFDFEGDVIEGSMLVTRWSEFNQDREQGKQIVQRLLDDVAAEVRKEASLPENPISKAGIAKDLVKGDLARALVKSIVGGTIDALTGTQAKEVWAVRQESYRAWAKGIASVLDPRGGHGTDGMSERERKYFDKGRSSVANLDEVQKYQAHLSLIDNVRLNSFQPQVADFTYFSERWSGGAILTGAAVHPNGYERSDYRYR